MGKKIDYFSSMPDDVQANAERHAVDVIYESFVVPADQDFLMARFLAQNGLHRNFYWAAAQAIEKYLKAFILMNGGELKNSKDHSIKKLFEVAKNIDHSLASIDTQPHNAIIVHPELNNFVKKFSVSEFVKELDTHGNSNNRYNAMGIVYNTGHLFALDSFSFNVRRKIGAPSIDFSFKGVSENLMEAFNIYNPWFNSGLDELIEMIPNKDFCVEHVPNVTWFEFIRNNEDKNVAYNIALKWLREMMKLPK